MIHLIGINGVIGSGKDTVGNIIQELTSPYNDRIRVDHRDNGDFNIVPLRGTSEWQIKKFAFKLKQVASLMLGYPVELFEDQEFKKQVLPLEWNYFGPSIQSGGISTADIVEKQMDIRTFLQKLGTEAVRDGLHTNAWVNALFSDYKLENHSGPTRDMRYPKWIITDCRFPNEAQAVKDKGGIIIRVNRPGIKSGEHPSETALNNWDFDYIIDNSAGLEELREKVAEMLTHFKIPFTP